MGYGRTPGAGAIATLVKSVREFGAVGDGTTDDTTAVQAAITAAVAAGVDCFFPAGNYRVGALTIPAGAVLQGVNSGGHGISLSDALHSKLSLKAAVNAHMFTGAQGAAHVRLRDLHLSGNKTNQSAGDIIHLSDVGTAEECQWHIERCYVESGWGYGLYVGAGRRACVISESTFNYNDLDGIRLQSSDHEIHKCICGGNTVNGITNNGATNRILSNDVYGNTGSGIVVGGVTDFVVIGNGIDRNQQQGLYINPSATSGTVTENIFHSNSQAGNGSYGHIKNDSTLGKITIANNIFGPKDGDVTNVPSYGVVFAAGAVAVTGYGNVIDSTSTVSGLTSDTAKLLLDAHADSHRTGGTDDLLLGQGLSRTRVETFSRYWQTGDVTPTSGAAILTYFTAPWTLTVGKILLTTGGTTPSGLTVARLGLYTIAGNGDATLVARTANDAAAIAAAANTLYQPALDTTGGYPATYQLVRGTAYALAVIVVASTTVPKFRGNFTAASAMAALTPRMGAHQTGQSDLPTSITNANQANLAAAIWMAAIA